MYSAVLRSTDTGAPRYGRVPHVSPSSAIRNESEGTKVCMTLLHRYVP